VISLWFTAHTVQSDRGSIAEPGGGGANIRRTSPCVMLPVRMSRMPARPVGPDSRGWRWNAF